jgi:hypothetical protein
VVHKILGVLKNIEFRQKKPKGVLAFGFIDKRVFTVKTDQKWLFTAKMGRKSVFHPCEVYILARLDITMLYTIFYSFQKYRFLTQNPKG